MSLKDGVRLDRGLELFGQFTVYHRHSDSDDEFQLFVMQAAVQSIVISALVPDPEGPGRLRSLERSLRGCGAVLGPTVPLAEAPTSLSRARELAELVRTGVVAGSGVLRWSDHLPELLLSRDTALVAELARVRLAPLAGMRAPQRERMADTLLAWLESGFNANEAAERLRIHPQTVRYRMRQLEGLFGARLREPGARFELELALRARRLLGPIGQE
jgi:DNA-binding PucR family transcriptional regulator